MLINPASLQFLVQLAQNNNKPWFDAHKSEYETARENIVSFVSQLIVEIKGIEPIVEKEPKKYVSRIYRDIRFSKDKTPYKDFFGCEIERAPNFGKCPFYIHLKPGDSFIGVGLWQPETNTLKKMRQELDYNGANFDAIVKEASTTGHFNLWESEKLSRQPKGIAADHPFVEYLKLKQFLIHKPLPDMTVCSPNFIHIVVESYKSAGPFMAFIDGVLA